jgi:UDP-2,3-diacylglucosamine pyrophosphatase LpxH
VIYTVGNHDDILTRSAADRAVVEKHWKAEICSTLDLKKGKKLIRIEHGHENDPYNKTSDTETPHGKKLVQKTLPILLRIMPTLFRNIGDVVNRSLLPSFVLGNLAYKVVFPYAFSLVAIISGCIAIYTGDRRYAVAAVLVLVSLWLIFIITDLILRIVAEHALGGGSKYMNRVDNYARNEKLNVLVYGHTHNGGVEKRKGYVYVNGGCNDVIAKPRIGWLGLYKFDRYIQMSNILIDENEKESIKYEQEIIPLVE